MRAVQARPEEEKEEEEKEPEKAPEKAPEACLQPLGTAASLVLALWAGAVVESANQ